MEIVLSILEFTILVIFNSILPGILLTSIFNKHLKMELNLLNILIFIILGQLLNGLILYYIFLVLPGFSSLHYLIFIILASLIIFILYFKHIVRITEFLFSIFHLHFQSIRHLGSIKYLKANKIVILLLLYAVFGISLFLFRYLVNHDALIYAIIGNILSETTEITYKSYMFYETYGLTTVSNHGFGFPLFKTIENLFNFASSNSDNYYRFIPIINGAFLLILTYLYLKKYGENVALFSSILIFASGSFIFSIAAYGSTSVSYSLFIVALIYIYELTKKINKLNIIIFSMAIGLGGTIHSINFILLPALLLFFLIVNKDNLLKKISVVFLIIIIAILFGCIHYTLEIFYGNGWIFGKKYNLITKILRIFL